MQELEKIEIEQAKREPWYRLSNYDVKHKLDGAINRIADIIRENMNDGWIPVEERMPEDEIPTPKLVTALVPDRKARWDNSETFSLIVDTDVYDPDYMGKWEYYKKNVIA